MKTPYPVPFAHAAAAVDSDGRVIWSQGELDRVFPLASVTKIITSLGALRAVEMGALELGSPVGVRVAGRGSPGGSLSDGGGQPYSVSHLLSHSSGLDVEGDGTKFKDAPGRRRIYSNQGFEVLGQKVQEATGVALPKWLDSQVHAPLGLRSTVVQGSPARSGFGNALDLTLLGEELLQPQLMNPKTHSAMITPVLPGLRGLLPGYGMQQRNDWGLGVEIKVDKRPHWTPPSASPATFGHFGMSGSFLWVDPARDVAAVFVGEEPFGPWHKENWPKLGEAILQEA